MKLWNVSFAQRYFLSIAFISCLPALLSFTGSKFPCEFISCCCSGDLCSACTWLPGSPEDLQPLQQQNQEQHSHAGPMTLQDHAFGISHWVSWKHGHNLVNALFFLMSNNCPSLSHRMKQDVVTGTGICLNAGYGMIQGWNNASPLR